MPLNWWRTDALAKVGLPSHIEEHIVIMCRLHQENRYDWVAGVQRVTGLPAQTIEQFVSTRRDFYLGG